MMTDLVETFSKENTLPKKLTDNSVPNKSTPTASSK